METGALLTYQSGKMLTSILLAKIIKTLHRKFSNKWTNGIVLECFFTHHEKLSFPLRISSVNVTKSAGYSGFGHIY